VDTIMSSQLTLALEALPDRMRAEAERRGLDIDASIEDRDRRMVGVVSGAIAALNFILDEARAAGFEIAITWYLQDVVSGPRRAIVRAHMKRVAAEARV
jgi:hypothetical protein